MFLGQGKPPGVKENSTSVNGARVIRHGLTRLALEDTRVAQFLHLRFKVALVVVFLHLLQANDFRSVFHDLTDDGFAAEAPLQRPQRTVRVHVTCGVYLSQGIVALDAEV